MRGSHTILLILSVGLLVGAAEPPAPAASVTTPVRAVAWGTNLYGQLGNGTNTDSNVPVRVKGMGHAVAVAGGDQHNLAGERGGASRRGRGEIFVVAVGDE